MHVVLDAHAAPPCYVDARLNRHYRALGQRLGGGAREPWRFVHFETQAMTRRMPERRTKAACFDGIARQRVRFPPTHAGADTFTRSPLRLLHQSIQRAL